jgi:hypothetical protein
MKTQTYISSLKKSAISAFTVVVLAAGNLTGLRADQNDGLNSLAQEMNRLEMMAGATEVSLQYEAPSAEMNEDIVPSVERLESMAFNIEESLQYKAPAAEETEEVNSAVERLETLAANTEQSIRFEAPEIEDASEFQNDGNEDNTLVAF